MALLTNKERQYWENALPRPPITRDFDELYSSEIVLELKQCIKELYHEGEGGGGGGGVDGSLRSYSSEQKGAGEHSVVWSQVSQLVRQLQEARKVIRRLMVVDKNVMNRKLNNKPPTPTKKPSRLSKPSHFKDLLLLPEREDSNTRNNFNNYRSLNAYSNIKPPSPVIAPPSPIRAPRPKFCANNVEASLQAMKRHKKHPKIQEQGCRAIVELIKEGKKRKSRENEAPKPGSWHCSSCKFLNSKSEISCRICSMSKMVGNEIKNTNTCQDTANSRNQEKEPECDEIERRGGIELVVDAMRNFPSHKNILKSAAFALAQMVHENNQIVERIASAGGIKQVLNTMKTLFNDQEVQTQCLGILASPTLSNDNVIRVEEEMFAKVVCSNIRLHKSASRLQALGCLALANLALKSDQYCARLVTDENFRCHELMIEILKRHASEDHPHIVASSLWLLVVLARDLSDGAHDEIRGELKQVGVIQATMACISSFPTSQSIQNNGRLLFSRLQVEQSLENDTSAVATADGCSIS